MTQYNLVITYDDSNENTYKATTIVNSLGLSNVTNLLPDEIELVKQLGDFIGRRCRCWKCLCPTCGRTVKDPEAINCSNPFHNSKEPK